MKSTLRARLALALVLFTPFAFGASRSIQPFDADWLFLEGDTPSADDPMLDDVNWEQVNLPHDWSILQPARKTEPSGRGGGYRATGVSWYRKRFALPEADENRRVFVEFDGVMADSQVWINGHPVGGRASGYVSFRVELTGFLKWGEDETNILAVRTDTSVQPDSRWYSGQGIYRHVRLVLTDPVQIAPGGLFVTTPEIAADHATAQIHTSVYNGSDHARDLAVSVQIFDPAGQPVGTATATTQAVGIGATVDFTASVAVPAPQRWDVGQGQLYRAVATVNEAGQALDDVATTFGIRDLRFESATGFWINGHNVKIKGVALHHAAGAFGAAVPLDVWRRRLVQLQSLGVNAIRTAHNPPDPGFLDLCDQLGLLVMDEFFDAWTVGKPSAEQGSNRFFLAWGHRDERDTLRRDRNHPSIILWSVGNEIHDTPNAPLAKRILAGLVGIVHEEDPTRPVTQALFRPNTSHDYDNGLADMLDVIGTNYRDHELLAAWQEDPTRKIIGTEQRQDLDTWLAARDNAPHAGQFLWVGIDYLGEADWPNLNSVSGLLDRTGRIKPQGYQRQSWWSDTPMVYIVRDEPGLPPVSRRDRSPRLVPNWTPVDPESYQQASLTVYSNCDEVELFLNDTSLGAQPKPADDSPRTWDASYAPGTLRAVGRNGGQEVASCVLRTAGPPARLIAEVDQTTLSPGWESVATITVRAVDAQGVPTPWADDLVSVKIDGPGKTVAIDNGNRTDNASFQGHARKLHQGECVAFVRPTADHGTVTITASAPGLESASIMLTAARP